MPTMTYEHGVPSWVDLGTAEPEAALSFYGGLLGWTGRDLGEQAGHYTMALLDGDQVAGIGPAQDPGPPRWTTYVNVDDVDQAAARAKDAGGQCLAGPMDVMDQGRLAILSDTTGAVVGAWQPGAHRGADRVNEPGAFIWCELMTADLAAARAFYGAVFGWSFSASDDYVEVKVGERTVAGMLPRPPDLPAGAPDHWLVYFGSADLDDDLEQAARLGGTVLVPARAIADMGRFAVLADPDGATFALYEAAGAPA